MLGASLGDSQESVDCNLAFSSTWWGGGNPEIVKGVGGGSGAGIFGGVVYESEYMAQIDFGTFAWAEEWKKGVERIPSAWLRWTIGSLLDGRMENLQESR